MLLNSDTIMMPNAMFALRMGLYASEQNGMAGSVSNHAGNTQDINEIYGKVSEYAQFAGKNNVPRENVCEYKVWLAGFALLLKRGALDAVGLLDERSTPGTYEDNDLGIRDVTHLRFFTLEGIVQLFECAGYQITQMMSVFMEWAVTDHYKGFFDQLLAIDGVADRQQFHTYQYLIQKRIRSI